MLPSCKKDFLDVVPTDRIPKAEFFKTEADLTAAIYGVYAAQRNLYTSAELALYNLEETRSDNTNQKFGLQTEHRAVDNFTADAGNTSITGMWGSAYYCINMCNTVIDRGAGVNMDETRKKQMLGEAMFVRAMTYFQLLQDYGGVPLRVNETVGLSGNNNLKRATPEEMYQQIITDLTAASVALPPNYSGTGKGRATSYAAYTLLGKVQLQKGDKPAAVTALRKVVFPGTPYSLINYADLWNPATKNSAESIYEIQFLPPLSGSPFWNSFAPASLNVPGGNNRSVSPNTPTADLINEYEAGDIRLNASIAYDGTGRPYILKFKDANVGVGNDARNNFPVLRYADALLMLAEALGETSESYNNLIFPVRQRANLGAISSATPGTFIDKVMHERRVEFAFECQRWHDLLRWGSTKAISVMNAHLANEFPGANISIDAHDLVAPLPITEGQTNSLVVQNDGYTPFKF